MKKLFLITIACLLMAPFTGYAHSVSIPKTIDELALTKVTDSVYVVHGTQGMPDKSNKGFISNSGFVVSDEGIVIIDSGGSLEVGEMLLQKIRDVSDKPVVAVFNTHLHGDHWLGNAAIRKAYPDVKIYAHERTITRLKAGEADQWVDIFTQAVGEPVVAGKAVLPDTALKGGEKLEIAGNTYNAHYTGKAHTDTDIMIEYPADKALFGGDIIITGSVVSAARPEDFSAKGQIAALDYALKLPVDTYVPGHGPTGGREAPEATKRFLAVV